MFTEKHVTLKLLNQELQEGHILLSNSSLGKVLHDIGFKFKRESNRRALTEKTSIATTRLHFLRQYLTNKECGLREVVFLDETWIYSKGSARKSWQDENVKSVRKPEGYDGKRFIVLHAGSRRGFITGSSLLFASKSQKEDYHGEMNGEMFAKWVKDQLINNLEEPSLIVMDNAPYHSMLIEKQPTSAWTKGSIISFLTENNIPFDKNLFKSELLVIAKRNTKPKRYVIDELLRHHGHEVLRLPPYHCEFNAIEMIWAHSKQYYDKHIGRDGYGDKQVLDMWNEALQQCSENVWQNCVSHTENVIQKWYEREKMLDVKIDELIINIGKDSSSESDESDID